MQDSNKTVPSCSSLNLSSPGNNENESESQRNSHSKSKHFMAPTISATSKHTLPKKNILKEPNSGVPKPGNQNSGFRKSLPKTPSPKYVIPSDDVGNFLADSCVVPYDPLTNYLSPRPRFLRYRPNRSRKLVVESEDEESESSGSEISLNQENEEEEESVVDQGNVVEEKEEEEDEYEEVFGDQNWGWKWVLMKWVFVVSALFLCSMWICNVKSDLPVLAMNSTVPIETVNFTVIRPEIKGLNVEFDDLDDLNFKFVSLSRVHSGVWVNQGGERSDVGQIELNDSGFKSGGKFSENDEMSNGTEVNDTDCEESVDCWDEYFRMQSRFRNEDYSKDGRLERDSYNSSIVEAPIPGLEEHNLDLDSKSENKHVKGEASVDDSEHSEGPKVEKVDDSEHSEGSNVENVVDSEPKKSDIDRNSENGVYKTEVERVSEFKEAAADMGNDVENVTEVENAVDDSDATSVGGAADEAEFVVDNEEPKLDGKQSETVSLNAGEDFAEASLEVNVIGNDVRQPRLDHKEVNFVSRLLQLMTLAFFGLLVRELCCKRKRASSRMRSSNSRLPTRAEFVPRGRQRLPAKTGEKSVQASEVYHKEMKPPSPIVPITQERLDEYAPRRAIPVVKQVGELDLGTEFTSSLKSCSIRSEMSKRDEAIYSGVAEVKALHNGASLSARAATVQPSYSEASTADSHSHGSEYSSKKDRTGEVSTVMLTPRRSARIRKQKVTSP